MSLPLGSDQMQAESQLHGSGNMAKQSQGGSARKPDGSLNDYASAYLQFRQTFDATLQIVSSRNKDEIIKGLGRTLSTLFPYIGCAFLLSDPVNGVLYADQVDGFEGQYDELVLRAVENSLAEWVLAERRIAAASIGLGVEEDRFTGIWVPLICGEERFGVLFIAVDLKPESITEIEHDLLHMIASQSAVALENTRLVENSELQAAALQNVKNYLESVLESMPSGLVAADFEGRITLFNQSASQLLGVGSDEAIGLTFYEVLRPDLAHVFEQMLERGREQGALTSREIELGEGESLRIPVRVVPSLLREGDGQPVGMIYVLVDLREERELSQLRRLDQLKDQFISAVSHELRTPITAIKSFSEILLDYDDPETRREFLEIISRESDRLARLVNDILDLSKIEAGMMNWDIEDFPIQDALKQSLDSVRILAAEKNIKLKVNCGDEPIYVRADRERIVQVLINLLSNAIKFTPEGGEVTVGCERMKGRRRTDTCDYAKVWVRDTGIGIPKHFLPLIFDRFQQVTEGQGLTNRPKGTGLGLPISREIVQHLGGNMWVESEEGKGSTFYFTLPLATPIREVTYASEGHTDSSQVPTTVEMVTGED